MPGTNDLMAGYSNNIGGLMAGHNSMVSGLMAGNGGQAMAGQAWALPPGVSFGQGPMNPTGAGGGAPAMFGMESDDPELQRKLRLAKRLKSGKMNGQAPGMDMMMPGGDNLSFGGAFANGGIAPAGKVSLVGERGPELIMPTGPTKVVPINPLDRHVNRFNARGDKQLAENADHYSGLEKDYAGMAKDYQEMMLSYQDTRGQHKPGTPEYEAANKSQNEMYDQFVDKVRTQEQFARDAAKNRGLIGTGQGWKDHVTTDEWSQRRAEAAMAAMRERNAMRPGGSQFSGPLMPTASIDAAFSQPTAAPQGSDGRLVASSNGGVKWQQGSGAGFGAPPQSRAPAMRPIDAAFTDNSLSGRASSRDGAVRTGSLSERGASSVGSGPMTPERRMKMLARRAWTRGDDSAVANLTQASFGMEQRGIDRAFQAGQQGEQRDFMRERDATNHAQGMQMWNLDRSFQLDAEGRRNQAALDAEGRRNQRGDAEWTRSRDAELEDRKNSAIDAPFTMTDPSGKFVIPGVKTRGGDFKPMGGAYPVHTPTTPPSPGEIAKHISDNMAKGIIADWDGKSFRYSPIKPDKPGDQGSESTVYDDAGGIIQRTVRTPKGASAPAAPAVDPKARLNALRAAAGLPAL